LSIIVPFEPQIGPFSIAIAFNQNAPLARQKCTVHPCNRLSDRSVPAKPICLHPTGLTSARVNGGALARSIGLTILIMPVTVLIYASLSRLIGLSETDHASLILLAAAPPIASSAGLCFPN